ncbi:hypothetical protein [Deinococcus navajonensis]|uniref:NnrS family protein n=1 Tax=Deinococcus navajonensis TaxID=309884 RepID=A0ABV8XRJ7_9DEIO
MTATPPARSSDAASHPGEAAPYRARLRQHLITILLGWWLVSGLFLDGWAHNHSGEALESFFTPWHAVFYSGFGAVAGWSLWLASRGWRLGRRGLKAFPEGYHLAALGVPLFALGGLGDLTWHTIFGIEVGIEALLSPTHLLLFAGAMLILASPLVAVWRSPASRTADGPRWVAVLSTASLLAVTAFMHMYMWGLLSVPQGLGPQQTRGELSAILLTALVLAAPVLLLLRRFALPFGAITLMYTLTNTGLTLMLAPGTWRLPLLSLVCGLLADALQVALRPSPTRVWALRAFALLLPLSVWVPFLAGAVRLGLSSISLELWLGVAVMAGLGGLALSALVVPPPVPREGDA